MRIVILMVFTIIFYLLFLSFNFILGITILNGLYVEFHSGGFVILISFSFSIASMRSYLLAGKKFYSILYKINIGSVLVSQTSMCGILLNSYYSLSYKLKLRDISFEVLVCLLISHQMLNS